jgi:hypothetical protein
MCVNDTDIFRYASMYFTSFFPAVSVRFHERAIMYASNPGKIELIKLIYKH